MRGVILALVLAMSGCASQSLEEGDAAMLSEGQTSGFAAAIQGHVRYCKLAWSDIDIEFVMNGSTEGGCSATVTKGTVEE